MNRTGLSVVTVVLCVLFTGPARAWAADTGSGVPAASPEWLSRLLPHTGKPDRLTHRLRRVEAAQFEVDGRVAGSIVVELTYPGLAGQEEVGRARIFLPPILRETPGQRMPLVHIAGYELDQGGAARLLARGYVVSTPHAHPLNPLGRGVGLDRAILHAAHRLPFVDPLRVAIQGGSAGGWMTLMLAADAFPLVWSMPDVPPIHLGYNAAYIGEQQALAGAPVASEKPRLPVLAAVGGIAEQSRTFYGVPYDDPAFLAVSPLAHLDTITVPTLVTFSTADMLVPIDQVGAEFVQPRDPSRFPEGFSTAMTRRFPGVRGKRTLLKALPAERFQLFRVPHADGSAPPDRVSSGGARPLVLPFSRSRIWSIVVIDEGPVEPALGHFKHAWEMDREPFRQWAENRGVTADQLTAPKLKRLMQRLRGVPWRPLRVRPGGKGEEVAGNTLDYPEAERADVLLGLAAFAADDARAVRLARLYARLPRTLKVLGDRLGDGDPAGVRAALKELAGSSAVKGRESDPRSARMANQSARPASAPEPMVFELWPGPVPGDVGLDGPERSRIHPSELVGDTLLITNVTRPSLTVYLPPAERATGTAMVICPGGGYHDLFWALEGEEVAAWLNSQGIDGIILKYRVPRRPGDQMGVPPLGPLLDAQRAISMVRSRAGEWGIDPRRIGMVGFSAGGHLALATATEFHERRYPPIDAIDRTSCRPDFAILCYSGYLKADGRDEVSTGIRVPSDTPPIFLAHASDDSIAEAGHSVIMYLALQRAGVPAELHVYATGEHDFGVRRNDALPTSWPDLCLRWLRSRDLLSEPQR